MSFLRRAWLTVSEIGVLLLGLFVSVFAAALFSVATSNPDGDSLVLLACLVLTVALVWRLRRRHAKWKMQFDAERYERERAFKRSHPVGARWKRAAVRIGIGLPTLFAAFVLFFLPQASHLLHPGGVHLGLYRIPIPWDMLIVPGPSEPEFDSVIAFAGNDAPGAWARMFHGNRFPAMMSFLLYPAPRRFREQRDSRGPDREFKLGTNVLRCWERVWRDGSHAISCATSGADRSGGLSAAFQGAEVHIPAFYRILAGIQTRSPGSPSRP